MDVTLLIFLLVYVAMGFGQLPGFRVDRTGAALIGMLAMIVAGSISPEAAWDAIDYGTIALLFGLMVVAAAFNVAGFYAWIAARVASANVGPPTLLAILIVTGAVLSSLLTNDVVAVAMVPLMVSITLARKLNPVPFLLGFCFAVNTGAVATLIGSPHNMIAAQVLHLSFVGYFTLAIVPALVSLPIVWGIVAFVYRGRWELSAAAGAAVSAEPEPTLDVWETVKTGIVTIALVIAFVFEIWRPELVALAAAGFLLLNRKISSRDMLSKVDGNLLILVMGLFVVNAALAETGVPKMLVADARAMGLDIDVPWILLWVVSVISDIVGNNPAVMLMLPLLHGVADPEAIGVTLSLATSFSGNIFVFGSLAGIIVVEQAAARGIKISFGEFMRAGAPVTAACMAVATAWTMWLGS